MKDSEEQGGWKEVIIRTRGNSKPNHEGHWDSSKGFIIKKKKYYIGCE